MRYSEMSARKLAAVCRRQDRIIARQETEIAKKDGVIVRGKKTAVQKDGVIAKKDGVIAKKDEKLAKNRQYIEAMERHEKELDALVKQMERERAYVEGQPATLQEQVTAKLDGMIGNKHTLYTMTKSKPGLFRELTDRVTERILVRNQMPMFRDDPRRVHDPGNRCKLHIRHAVLLTLMSLRTSMTQDELEHFFFVDQGRIQVHPDGNGRHGGGGSADPRGPVSMAAQVPHPLGLRGWSAAPRAG